MGKNWWHDGAASEALFQLLDFQWRLHQTVAGCQGIDLMLRKHGVAGFGQFSQYPSMLGSQLAQGRVVRLQQDGRKCIFRHRQTIAFLWKKR